MRKVLRLLSETDESTPTDISFVYSGYAPLTVRLVQCIAHKSGVLSSSSESTQTRESDPDEVGTPVLPFAQPISGWKGFEDAVRSVPGATVDKTQHGATSSNEVDARSTSLGGSNSSAFRFRSLTSVRSSLGAVPATGRQTTTMVFFLGGCTFTEIAALRWLNTQMKGTVR